MKDRPRTGIKETPLLNRQPGSPHIPKLSEVLFERKEHSFASLAALPSNVEAIEAALLFSAGMNRFVAIVGPSGWGKTHLMRAVAYRLSLDGGNYTDPASAQEFLSSPHRFESTAPLVLDDVQDTFGKARQRLALRFALERRIRAGRPTILAFTSPKPNRQLKAFLPSARDWEIASMGEPVPAERVLLLNQMASAEGLALSPRLVRMLADHMHGNGRTLAGALKRLRLSGPNWLDTGSTLRALGLLEPFFADNSGWDLKMRILRLAERSRAQFGKVNPLDMALFTMLREAGLAESDVARAADLTNADVYQRCMRFQKQMETCDVTATNLRQFVELVVGSLARD
jgi:energy-coupling factor transporter ATP-binding protein EcfA2